MKAVITLALPGPIAVPVFDGLLNGFAVRPTHEIDHGRGAAVQRRSPHHRWRIGVGHAAIRMGRVPFQMHMRIDATRYDDLPGRVDQSFGGFSSESAGRSRRHDFLALNRQITRRHTSRRHHPVAAYHQIEHS